MSRERRFGKKLLIGCCLLLAACNPFKVTDPSDPRFDPMKFSFLDYGGIDERAEVFGKLFPLGSEKAYVHAVLLDAGHAKIIRETPFQKDNSTYIGYGYIFEGTNIYRTVMGLGPVTVTLGAAFDDNNKLISINYKNKP